jgi:hypothetical protein
MSVFINIEEYMHLSFFKSNSSIKLIRIVRKFNSLFEYNIIQESSYILIEKIESRKEINIFTACYVH